MGGWVRKGLAWFGGIGKSRPTKPAEHQESDSARAEELIADNAEPGAADEFENDEFVSAEAALDETTIVDEGDEDLVGVETATVEARRPRWKWPKRRSRMRRSQPSWPPHRI
jgi:hypothetical protein